MSAYKFLAQGGPRVPPARQQIRPFKISLHNDLSIVIAHCGGRRPVAIYTVNATNDG